MGLRQALTSALRRAPRVNGGARVFTASSSSSMKMTSTTTLVAEAKAVVDRGGVVFGHSMANLILGGACHAQEKCGVKWFGIQGPWGGSNVAAASNMICGGCEREGMQEMHGLDASY